MRRCSFLVVTVVSFLSLQGLAVADELTSASDLDLIAQTRDAVKERDANRALDLLTEMRRRGTGIFAGVEPVTCEEVISLPDGISDWKFRAVARQAYFRTAMSRRLEEASCTCLFDNFSFDAFIYEALGKPASELTDADRLALEGIRDDNRRQTEAQFRDLEQSCRAN